MVHCHSNDIISIYEIERKKKMKRHRKKVGVIGLYALYNKGELVYIGESTDIYTRAPNHRYDKYSEFDEWLIICPSERLPFLKDVRFRKYYEDCCIKWLKPKYQEHVWKYKRQSLNFFLMKVFLHKQNPNPDINPLISEDKGFMGKYVYPKVKNKFRKRKNKYISVWETIDLNKKIYVDGKSAFKELVDTNMIVYPTGNAHITKFKKIKERLHNIGE